MIFLYGGDFVEDFQKKDINYVIKTVVNGMNFSFLESVDEELLNDQKFWFKLCDSFIDLGYFTDMYDLLEDFIPGSLKSNSDFVTKMKKINDNANSFNDDLSVDRKIKINGNIPISESELNDVFNQIYFMRDKQINISIEPDNKELVDKIIELSDDQKEINFSDLPSNNAYAYEISNKIITRLKKEKISFYLNTTGGFYDFYIKKDSNLFNDKNYAYWNPFYKIRKITIRYLFGYLKYDFEIDDNIFVIHAPNGFGKSTLLKTVLAFYNNDYDELFSLPFYETLIKLEEDHKTYTKDGNVYAVTSYIFTNDFDGNHYLSINGQLTDNNDYNENRYMAFQLFDNNKFKKQKASSVINYISNFDKTKFEKIVVNKEKITDIFSKNIELFNRLIKDFFLDEKEVCLDISDLDSDYIFKDHLIIKNNMDCLIDVPNIIKTGEKIPFKFLSSGEKYIIYVLISIIFSNMTDYSLIILDEPELYLHIEWQQKLINVLHEISEIHKSYSNDDYGDESIRILVATHSPYFVNSPYVKVGNPEYEEE